ncbi:MAG: hypothetical protein ACR2OG_13725 [Gemmatimonadaceae bacterium]
MNRLAASAAIALLVAACTEPATAPATLGVSAPSLDLGTAPPPRLTGGGSATLVVGTVNQLSLVSATATGAASVACQGQTSFGFTYDYLINPVNNNAFLHLKLDGVPREVTLHQTLTRSDAHGSIGGDGFIFDITDALSLNLIDSHTRTVTHFSALLTGTLTHADGTTCQASAVLAGFLGGDVQAGAGT